MTLEFKHFIVVNYYAPNSKNDLSRLKERIKEWDTNITSYLCHLRAKRGKPVILAGDLNVAHRQIDCHDPIKCHGTPCFTTEERKSFGNLLDKGFVDIFRHKYPHKKQFTVWDNRFPDRKSSHCWGWRYDYMLIDRTYLHIVEDTSIH